MKILMTIIVVISAIGLIATVLLQSGKSQNVVRQFGPYPA